MPGDNTPVASPPAPRPVPTTLAIPADFVPERLFPGIVEAKDNVELGFSVDGMLMKNEIVLLDQINLELAKGKAPMQAVVDSAVSRVRPVAMSADQGPQPETVAKTASA